MTPLEIVKAIEVLIDLATKFGVNVAKIVEMKKASGGKLSDEDLQTLADDAQSAIDTL